MASENEIVADIVKKKRDTADEAELKGKNTFAFERSAISATKTRTRASSSAPASAASGWGSVRTSQTGIRGTLIERRTTNGRKSETTRLLR